MQFSTYTFKTQRVDYVHPNFVVVVSEPCNCLIFYIASRWMDSAQLKLQSNLSHFVLPLLFLQPTVLTTQLSLLAFHEEKTICVK